MSNSIIVLNEFKRAREANTAVSSQLEHLDFGGGGGDSGGMEARVARLEDDFREMKADIKALRGDTNDVKVKLAELGAKMDGLAKLADKIPTGWTFFGVILSTMVAVPTLLGALVLAARSLDLIPKP